LSRMRDVSSDMTRPGARGVFGEEGWEGHHCICSLACNRPQITTGTPSSQDFLIPCKLSLKITATGPYMYNINDSPIALLNEAYTLMHLYQWFCRQPQPSLQARPLAKQGVQPPYSTSYNVGNITCFPRSMTSAMAETQPKAMANSIGGHKLSRIDSPY